MYIKIVLPEESIMAEPNDDNSVDLVPLTVDTETSKRDDLVERMRKALGAELPIHSDDMTPRQRMLYATALALSHQGPSSKRK